jgi:hypothetical protein
MRRACVQSRPALTAIGVRNRLRAARRKVIGMTSMAVLEQDTSVGSYELTSASLWRAFAGRGITDELLEWPPDLFALTDRVLRRSETYRFAMSPPSGTIWPPDRAGDWASAVTEAGRQWSAWLEDRTEQLPKLLANEWAISARP